MQYTILVLLLWTFAGVFLALIINLEGKKPNIVGKLLVGPAWILLLFSTMISYIMNFVFKRITK